MDDWENMTVDEKLDWLRSEIERAFRVSTHIQGAVPQDLSRLEALIGQLVRRVDELEKRGKR